MGADSGSRRRFGVVLPAAVILGIALMGAAAVPTFTPAGTADLVVKFVDSPSDITAAWFSGECAVGTTQAALEFSVDPVLGPPFTQLEQLVLNADGAFAARIDFITPAPQGSFGNFVLFCTDVEGNLLGEASLQLTVQNNAEPISVDASVVDEPFLVIVYCGPDLVDRLVISYFGSGITGQQTFPYTSTAIFSLGTPASLGYAVGDEGTLTFECFGPSTGSVVLFRGDVGFEITAGDTITDPPPPPGPAAAGDPELAATGVEGGGWMLAAFSFILCGVTILGISIRVPRSGALLNPRGGQM